MKQMKLFVSWGERLRESGFMCVCVKEREHVLRSECVCERGCNNDTFFWHLRSSVESHKNRERERENTGEQEKSMECSESFEMKPKLRFFVEKISKETDDGYWVKKISLALPIKMKILIYKHLEKSFTLSSNIVKKILL